MPRMRIPGGSISIAEAYKPGSMPPAGYLEWHEWADTQHKAGLRQKQCGQCGKWRFPQELSDQVVEYVGSTRSGKPIKMTGPICMGCVKTQQ